MATGKREEVPRRRVEMIKKKLQGYKREKTQLALGRSWSAPSDRS